MTKDQAFICLTKYVACDFGYSAEDEIFAKLCQRNKGKVSCKGCMFSENNENVKSALAVGIRHLKRLVPPEDRSINIKDFLE